MKKFLKHTRAQIFAAGCVVLENNVNRKEIGHEFGF